MTPLTFGSLFAGIGGIDLGFERAGMVCKWQVEIDDYCNRVLAKHWPDVRRYRDVKEVHGVVAHAQHARWLTTEVTERIKKGSYTSTPGQSEPGEFKGHGGQQERMGPLTNKGICPTCLPPVDVIAGGFPCQPHSVAGKRKGAADDRNLWPEYLRIVEQLRPAWVVGENVPGIVTTYLNTVLSDLEGAGYEVATFNLPAVAFDAKHRRERIFVVAYDKSERVNGISRNDTGKGAPFIGTYESNGSRGAVAHAGKIRRNAGRPEQSLQGLGAHGKTQRSDSGRPNGIRRGEWQQEQVKEIRGSENGYWPTEPDVGRVAHGIPNRVDRLRGLGNAVVPQVAEFVGRLIVDTEGAIQ